MNKFRVYFSPALEVVGQDFISATVGSYESAELISEALADYTLLLHRGSLMEDYSNFSIIQQEVNGEWVDFDPEDETELLPGTREALDKLTIKGDI